MSYEISPPVVLSIAGSDNSAGAGVQADLKTFTACGVYGLTVVTCVVAEVPGHVAAVQAVEPGMIRAQFCLSLDTYPVAAIKTGLLYSRAVVELVAELYGSLDPLARPPLVVDPVMVATSGRPLLAPDAVAAYRECLFPLATVVTPNLDEARTLLGGRPLPDLAALRAAGRELAAGGGTAFVVKGGHLAGETACDVLCTPDGGTRDFCAVRTADGSSIHGTGCTFSAALAVGLARSPDLPAAVGFAKDYVGRAIRDSFGWEHRGRPIRALCHAPPENNQSFSP